MDQELTYKWIQERLRELNSGTLAEQDRLRLVEIAKKDPFVADALEGFHAHPDSTHAAHLEVLAEKIKKTKRLRRRWLIPNLTVTAIAASVLLIIATYAVIMRMEKQSEEDILVFLSPDSLTLDDTFDGITDKEDNSPSPGDKEEEPYAAAGSNKKEPSAAQNSKSAANKRFPVADAAATAKDPDSPAAIPGSTSPDVSGTGDRSSAKADVADESDTELSAAKKDEGLITNIGDNDQRRSNVSGLVVDAGTGEPLLNAKLSVSYTNQLFYTDKDGRFDLFIPESEAVLHISYNGLVDTALIIRQGEHLNVVGLKESLMIPSMTSPGIKNIGPLSSIKQPEIESYYNVNGYIISSSTLELTTEPSVARRKVTIKFEVTRDGHPAEITVLETSRDKTYDGEAIRLITSGPDWVCPGESYPCTRVYTFYFR